ncbi:MAG: hypothetical protein RLN62_05520 [Rickettsiales bacterium]
MKILEEAAEKYPEYEFVLGGDARGEAIYVTGIRSVDSGKIRSIFQDIGGTQTLVENNFHRVEFFNEDGYVFAGLDRDDNWLSMGFLIEDIFEEGGAAAGGGGREEAATGPVTYTALLPADSDPDLNLRGSPSFDNEMFGKVPLSDCFY